MTTQNNTHAASYLSEVRQIIESKPANVEGAIKDLSRKYSGDENRFVRQEIVEALIGTKHPIAKCGIGMLVDFTMTYLRNLKAEATAPAPEVSEPAIDAIEPAQEPDGIAGIDYPMETKPAKAAKVEQPRNETKVVVGLQVIRKQCQRKGEVTAIEGQHVSVLLEDGSKRKPCMSRFKKLYQVA